jgi:Holliday junction resolvase RusA-like endonuclease
MEPVFLTFLGNPMSKDNAGGHWVPTKYRKYEAEIKRQCLEQYSGPPLHGFLEIECWFYFSTKPTNPDVGNYFKSVCDGLNKVLWADDNHIYDIHGHKRMDRVRPRVELKLWMHEEVFDQDGRNVSGELKREDPLLKFKPKEKSDGGDTNKGPKQVRF